jgi:hypothetical protein
MKLTRCQSVAAIVVSALIILAVVLGSLIGLAAKVQRGVLERADEAMFPAGRDTCVQASGTTGKLIGLRVGRLCTDTWHMEIDVGLPSCSLFACTA